MLLHSVILEAFVNNFMAFQQLKRMNLDEQDPFSHQIVHWNNTN